LGCDTISAGFEVIQSGPAVIAEGLGYTVTSAFTESQIITVNVEGYGTYQYSLNDGPLQDSPVFTNVPLGVNTITVWDTEGGLENSCEALIIEEVQTIGYPLYFTPNGDGINDTWNIVGLDASAKIHIFDRFGKLIKQISPEGLGWDGTYNGQFLPSTDYWFTVQYQEQGTKEFKAHFSLKR
jgi:gliding motility-associated-like protein